MTLLDAKQLGYTITVERKYILREAGWWWKVERNGRLIGAGWTAGFGPRAKTVAMRDALDKVRQREARELAGVRKGA